MKKPTKAHDAENPEWSETDVRTALSADEFTKQTGLDLPSPRGRPKLDKSKKRQAVTIRLDPAIIEHFKGDNPKGWQSRINEKLLKLVERES